jgi:hypothetical protein
MDVNIHQADGPHRPRSEILAAMLDCVPRHCEVRSVSINGQTGVVTVEVYHEELLIDHTFNSYCNMQTHGIGHLPHLSASSDSRSRILEAAELQDGCRSFPSQFRV